MDEGRRIALVTGVGRQAGIGAAICRTLARSEFDIVFTYWRPYDAAMAWGADASMPAALERDVRANGSRCEGIEIDLAPPDSATRLLDAAVERVGLPAVLVNNATVSLRDGYQTLDAASLDAHYVVNLRATALLCVELARRHPAGTAGRIINLTSGQSLGPMPEELAYAATKGAVEALTVSLAPTLAALGITINAVNPGPTDTGWMTDEMARELRPRFPLGRLGTPEDCARLVAFLASDEAGWLTGQIINSEGGFVRG